MDYHRPGSSHGILQARIVGWVAISFSRGSSRPRDPTRGSCTGRCILHHWATWETQRTYINLRGAFQYTLGADKSCLTAFIGGTWQNSQMHRVRKYTGRWAGPGVWLGRGPAVSWGQCFRLGRCNVRETSMERVAHQSECSQCRWTAQLKTRLA